MNWWLRTKSPAAPALPASVPDGFQVVNLIAMISHGVSPIDLTNRAAVDFISKVPQRNSTVDRSELELMFSATTVTWHRGEVKHDRMIVARGIRYYVNVQWAGSVAESQLFHAFLHLTNYAVRVNSVPKHLREKFVQHDIHHLEHEWWGLEGALLDVY